MTEPIPFVTNHIYFTLFFGPSVICAHVIVSEINILYTCDCAVDKCASNHYMISCCAYIYNTKFLIYSMISYFSIVSDILIP